MGTLDSYLCYFYKISCSPIMYLYTAIYVMLGSYVDCDDPAINSTRVNKRANSARIEVTAAAAAATVTRPI